MYYLTTCDDGQILTSHHRDLADLLDCTKSFMRAAMRDDPAFDELLLRHNAEAATWKNPDDEMEALVDKFEEELSNDCPQIVWGEVDPQQYAPLRRGIDLPELADNAAPTPT